MTTTRPRRPTPSTRRRTISPFDALRATLDAASARLESRLNQLDLILDVPISNDPRAELPAPKVRPDHPRRGGGVQIHTCSRFRERAGPAGTIWRRRMTRPDARARYAPTITPHRPVRTPVRSSTRQPVKPGNIRSYNRLLSRTALMTMPTRAVHPAVTLIPTPPVCRRPPVLTRRPRSLPIHPTPASTPQVRRTTTEGAHP